MKQVAVIHGPNLNLLGQREPDLYGTQTLDELNDQIRAHARKRKIQTEFFQTNHEGQLVDWVQDVEKKYSGCIINPAAYSHTSIALRDAIKALSVPVIEVHISNIFARESFRRKSMISAVSTGTLSGFGGFGYVLALEALVHILSLPNS